MFVGTSQNIHLQSHHTCRKWIIREPGCDIEKVGSQQPQKSVGAVAVELPLPEESGIKRPLWQMHQKLIPVHILSADGAVVSVGPANLLSVVPAVDLDQIADDPLQIGRASCRERVSRAGA